MAIGSLKLSSSNRAIAETEKAVHLLEQKERLEAAIEEGDASLSIDLAKAFLETIFKTILSDRLESPNLDQKFYSLFKEVKNNLEFNHEKDINEKISKLAGQIVHVITELRNTYGSASHGNDGYHLNPLTMDEVEFVVSAVDGLAAFLYKKHRQTIEPSNHFRLNYDDYPEFNDWLDEQYEGYTLPLSSASEMSFTASQMIFELDMASYREILIQYTQSEQEDEDE